MTAVRKGKSAMSKVTKHLIHSCIGIFIVFLLCLSFAWTVFADVQTVTGSYNYDAAYQMLSLVNQTRENKGLGPLIYDTNLENFAKQRAAEISVYNSHVRPDGSNTPYAENYSIGWASVGDAHVAFVNSPGHLSNIVGNFNAMGGASFSVNGQTYWVQIFSSSGTAGGPGGSGVVTESREVVTGNAPGSQAQYSDLDDSLTLKVGAYIKVTASVNGQTSGVSWSSDNPGIASVDSSGKISGISPGVCLVSGEVAGITKRIQVTVIQSGTASQAPPPPQNPPSTPPPPPQNTPSSPPPAPTSPTVEQPVQSSEELTTTQSSAPLTGTESTPSVVNSTETEEVIVTSDVQTSKRETKPSKSVQSEENSLGKESSVKDDEKLVDIEDNDQTSTVKKTEESMKKLKSFDKASKPDRPSKFMTFIKDGATGDKKTDTIIFVSSLSGFVIAGSILIHMIKMKR